MQHAQKHLNIFIIRTVYKSVANKRENFPQNKSSMVLTFGSNEKTNINISILNYFIIKLSSAGVAKC